MANADDVGEVIVENAAEVKVAENGEPFHFPTVEPAYVMEIEVNADGEVINQTTAEKAQHEHTDGNPVPVTELTENESTAVKSMYNNYLPPPASSNSEPTAVSNNVDVATTASSTATQAVIDQRLLENLVKGNGNVSVIQESGQVIIVLGQELSQSELENIKHQVARNEEKERAKKLENNTDVMPIPEPSCFTEQTSENSGHSAKSEDANQVHVCYQCKADFSTADELVHHFVQAHSTSVQCQYCDSVFPSIADANQHKKQRHVEIQCTMCKKTYYGTISLNQHVKLRHSKSTKCGSCYQYFDSREEMEKHIEQVHKYHKCVFCGKGFYFETSLDNHIEGEHGFSKFDHNSTQHKEEHVTGQEKSDPQVQHANKIPNTLAQRKSPNYKEEESRASNSQRSASKITKPADLKVNNVFETNGTRKSPRRYLYKCAECGDGFQGKASLADHIESKHGNQSTVDASAVNDLLGHKTVLKTEQDVSVKTEENDQKMTTTKPRRSSKSSNIKVQQIKEEPKEKAVNGVDYSPLRKSPRKRIAEESPQRPKKSNQTKTSNYSCDKCGISFKRDTTNEAVIMYSKHMAEHHSEFVCKKCDVDYKTNRGFMAHIKSEHKKSSDLPVCEYCCEEFRTKRTLALHRKDNWKRCSVAIGCTYCSEVFTTNKDLTSHHKRAHRGKPIRHK